MGTGCMRPRIDPLSDRMSGVPPPRQTWGGLVPMTFCSRSDVSLGTLRPNGVMKLGQKVNETLLPTFPDLVEPLLLGGRKDQLGNLVRPSAHISANHTEPAYMGVVKGTDKIPLPTPLPSMSVSPAPSSMSATSCTATSIEDRPV